MYKMRLREIGHPGNPRGEFVETIIQTETAQEAGLAIVLHLVRRHGAEWRGQIAAVRWLAEQLGLVAKPAPVDESAEARKRAAAVYAMLRSERNVRGTGPDSDRAITDLVVRTGVLGPAEGWAPPVSRGATALDSIRPSNVERDLMTAAGIDLNSTAQVSGWLAVYRATPEGKRPLRQWQSDMAAGVRVRLVSAVAEMILQRCDEQDLSQAGPAAALAHDIIARCERA